MSLRQDPNSWHQQTLKDRQELNNLIIDAFYQQCLCNPERRKSESVTDFKNLIKSYRPPSKVTESEEQWSDKVEKFFNDPISHQVDVEKFRNLFKYIDFSLAPTDRIENLGVVAKYESQKIEKKDIKIAETDLVNINRYMEESKSPAVVLVGSSKTGEFKSPDSDKQPLNEYRAIHSVGKVFTGVLVLELVRLGIIDEKKLNQPIEISKSLKETLSAEMQAHLSKVTLHQAMTHTSGLGDYLNSYQEAIKENPNKPKVTEINDINDLLPFADKNFKGGEIGKYNYSNTGILLVGLAIQHAYNEYRTTHPDLPKLDDYHAILTKYILGESNVSLKTHKPDGAKYNPDDQITPHMVGCPAGGYWTTPADLAKFCQYMYHKCEDTRFKSLLEKYGNEFYKNGLMSHSGDIPTSSAFVSMSPSTGSVIIVLSDQRDGAAREIAGVIRNNMFLTSIPAPRGKLYGENHDTTQSSKSNASISKNSLENTNADPQNETNNHEDTNHSTLSPFAGAKRFSPR